MKERKFKLSIMILTRRKIKACKENEEKYELYYGETVKVKKISFDITS